MSLSCIDRVLFLLSSSGPLAHFQSPVPSPLTHQWFEVPSKAVSGRSAASIPTLGPICPICCLMIADRGMEGMERTLGSLRVHPE